MNSRLQLAAALSIFLVPAAAFAHDCSSPGDCADVVKTTGWLEAALAAALALAAARAKGKRPYKDAPNTKHKWKDCNTAVAELRKMDGKEGRPTAASTKWDFEYELSGKSTRNADGSW